uniref:cDNA FLJ26776 fis, clone PRS03665 n=1 Tax=Homo sapiens TaxID=9606 RepID=Q6ZP04_HUMAN|nr:unnamed protein product [Homo sapiens]
MQTLELWSGNDLSSCGCTRPHLLDHPFSWVVVSKGSGERVVNLGSNASLIHVKLGHRGVTCLGCTDGVESWAEALPQRSPMAFPIHPTALSHPPQLSPTPHGSLPPPSALSHPPRLSPTPLDSLPTMALFHPPWPSPTSHGSLPPPTALSQPQQLSPPPTPTTALSHPPWLSPTPHGSLPPPMALSHPPWLSSTPHGSLPTPTALSPTHPRHSSLPPPMAISHTPHPATALSHPHGSLSCQTALSHPLPPSVFTKEPSTVTRKHCYKEALLQLECWP